MNALTKSERVQFLALLGKVLGRLSDMADEAANPAGLANETVQRDSALHRPKARRAVVRADLGQFALRSRTSPRLPISTPMGISRLDGAQKTMC